MKISIIGAGRVGTNLAQILALRNFKNIVLYNRTFEKAKGAALDILHACSIENLNCNIVATSNFADTENSDIIVITAGNQRREGQSREEIFKENLEIIKSIVPEIMKYNKNPIIIVVTNPVDAISYFVYKMSNIDRSRVIGMGGILDSGRFKFYISEKTNEKFENIEAIVIGVHGNKMLPIVSKAFVKNEHLNKILKEEEIKEIVEKTVKAGEEIIRLTGSSSIIAASIATYQIIKYIVFDEKKVFPCSVYLNGEYGLKDIFIGVPVKIGKNGIEEIIEIELNDEEKRKFLDSANSIKELIEYGSEN